MSRGYRILVTGSRTWDDYGALTSSVVRAVQAEARRRNDPGPTSWVTVVHGACPTGADALVDELCGFAGIWTVERHPADWDRYGKVAGLKRNAQMVDLGADLCLAFVRDNSPGACHTASLAETAGIPTMRFTYGEQRCFDCGCTDAYGCTDGCWWVKPDLCSSCARARTIAAAGVR